MGPRTAWLHCCHDRVNRNQSESRPKSLFIIRGNTWFHEKSQMGRSTSKGKMLNVPTIKDITTYPWARHTPILFCPDITSQPGFPNPVNPLTPASAIIKTLLWLGSGLSALTNWLDRWRAQAWGWIKALCFYIHIWSPWWFLKGPHNVGITYTKLISQYVIIFFSPHIATETVSPKNDLNIQKNPTYILE